VRAVRKHAKIGSYCRDYLPDEKLSCPQIWGYPPPPVYILYLYGYPKREHYMGKFRATSQYLRTRRNDLFALVFFVVNCALNGKTM